MRRLSLAARGLHEACDVCVEVAALVEERRESAVGVEERCAKRDGARAGAWDDSAGVAAHLRNPVGELFGAPHGRGEQKHSDARRREYDRFFPDVAAFFVGEVVRLVEHDEVGVDLLTAAQCVEELVAVDLCRADDERRVGLLLAVAGEYADFAFSELVAELVVLRVRKRLERACVPRALARGEEASNLFARNPGLAAARGRGDENVFRFERGERFELKRVGFERGGFGRADAFEQLAQRARARLPACDARGVFGG